ncbi:MAG: hypothetical protein JXO22_14010 [Phycisphaerae bacterium]|nr:hypothetical protein [Phycisphaerae bacterium]
MITKRAWIAVGVCIGLLVAGCGKDDSAPEQFNRVLGNTAVGVPVSSGTPDLGILQNPATYAGSAGSVGSSAAEDAEAGARALMEKVTKAAFDLDFFTILDSFDQARMGPLADQSVQEGVAAVFEKLDSLRTLWNERIADQEVAEMRDLWNRLMARLTQQAILDLLTYEVVDEDTVVVRADPTRAQALGQDLTQIVTESLGGGNPLAMLGGIGGMMAMNNTAVSDPNAVTASAEAEAENEGVVVARVNGEWRLRPPGPGVREDQVATAAQGVQMGLMMAQGVIDTIYKVIEDADTGTLNSPQLLLMEIMTAAQEGGGGGTMPGGFEDSFGDVGDPNMPMHGDAGGTEGKPMELTRELMRGSESDIIPRFMSAAENDDLAMLGEDYFRCMFTCEGRDQWQADPDSENLGHGDVSLLIQSVNFDDDTKTLTVSCLLDALVMGEDEISGQIVAVLLQLEDIDDEQRDVVERGFAAGTLRITADWRPVRVTFEETGNIARAAFVADVPGFILQQ